MQLFRHADKTITCHNCFMSHIQSVLKHYLTWNKIYYKNTSFIWSSFICTHSRVVLTKIYPGQHKSCGNRKYPIKQQKHGAGQWKTSHTGSAWMTVTKYDSWCTSWKRMMLITQAQSPAAAEDFCRTNSGLNSGSLRCSSLTHLTVASGMCSLSKFTRACRKSSTWMCICVCELDKMASPLNLLM